MSTPEEVVNNFMSAINNQDLDAALGFVAEDCYYDNVPIGETRGREKMRKILASVFGGGTPVVFELHRQAVTGNIVMNERTDTFTMAGRRVALPVAGIFEVNDGKITFWRDYFDQQMMTAAPAE
ncbi:MAG: limonene,2-epoxide hydrolase [Acidimicrobiaceae bacterium]|jgi:limonene-1,2-epoxide hydrolase|nr:limonene,2-epoxide hydrolase [Acidimicrobiaceae bacterium]